MSDANPGRNGASSGFATARKICAWQLAVGIAGSLLWGLHGGMHAAVAGLSGGLIAVISTFYFALRAFGHGQDATPERLLGSLLRAEVMKWGVTLALFMVAIVLFRDMFPPVISVYAACLLVYWFALGWTTTTSETDTEKGN